jgi:monovalent cation:H+ antiporter-2, CPA2 family
LVQITFLILLVSGLVVFAKPLYSLAEKWLEADWPAAGSLPVIFWFGFGILLLGPLIALWRNVEAVAMICAESASAGRAKRSVSQSFFERLVKGAALVAILVWLAALLPYEALPAWELAALAGTFVLVGAVFWRKLIRLHSRFEIELRTQLVDSPFAGANGRVAGWPKRNGERGLNLRECVIGGNTRAAARAVSELPLRQLVSCTIASIERQGVVIPNPAAGTVLYPNDKVLLLGRDEDLLRAERWLSEEAERTEAASLEPGLADLSLQHLTVPAVSRHIGKALGELPLKSLFGIQIVGIERDQRSVVSPGRSETLYPGDQLLILGAPEQVNEMAFWLST